MSPKKETTKGPTKNLAQRISDHICRSDDFGHELRVKAVVQGFNADVVHGWSYIDPHEKKPRQFDLRATFTNWGTERHFLRMPIECKNLDVGAPLIVSGIARTKDESFHHYVRSEQSNGWDKVSARHSGSESRFYPKGEFVGKSLLRLKPRDGKDGAELVPGRDKESDIHGSWSQALASAFDLCQQALLAGQSVPNGKVIESVILPSVVVPDGSLWTAEYSAVGRLISGPAPATSTTFFVNQTVTLVPNNHWMKISHVHFFTVSGLRQFLEPLTKGLWPDWFPASAEQFHPQIREH